MNAPRASSSDARPSSAAKQTSWAAQNFAPEVTGQRVESSLNAARVPEITTSREVEVNRSVTSLVHTTVTLASNHDAVAVERRNPARRLAFVQTRGFDFASVGHSVLAFVLVRLNIFRRERFRLPTRYPRVRSSKARPLFDSVRYVKVNCCRSSKEVRS